MGTGNALAASWKGEKSKKERSWPGWGLRVEGGLPPAWSLALKPKLLHQLGFIQFPKNSGGGAQRGPPWEDRVGGGQSH